MNSEFEIIFELLALLMMFTDILIKLYKLNKFKERKFEVEQNKKINMNFIPNTIGCQTNVTTPSSLNSPQTPYAKNFC